MQLLPAMPVMHSPWLLVVECCLTSPSPSTNQLGCVLAAAAAAVAGLVVFGLQIAEKGSLPGIFG